MKPDTRGIPEEITDDRTPAETHSIRDTIERVHVLAMCARMFDDDQDVCEEILKLCRRAPLGDHDLMKIRSFASSAGDTITAAEALDVIKAVARVRISRGDS